MESKHRHTNFFKQILARMRRQPRGQSFVELMLVVVFLALLLAGVVEFGFMLNQYLHVLDGAREAARFSSNNVPFGLNADGTINAAADNPSFYYLACAKAASTMKPVVLNPGFPDDIVISVFSVTTGNTPLRFPTADPNGWSLCNHYAAFAAYFTGTLHIAVPTELSNAGWSSGCTVRASQVSTATVQAPSAITPLPPSTGVLVVEVYYNYPQLLKLPVLTSVLADPVQLYVYTVMPLSSAAPTATPNH
jgi:hypothetical protein